MIKNDEMMTIKFLGVPATTNPKRETQPLTIAHVLLDNMDTDEETYVDVQKVELRVDKLEILMDPEMARAVGAALIAAAKEAEISAKY